MDEFDRFERRASKGIGLFFVGWVLSALLAIGAMGVGIWAIIELVQWIKTK